MHPLVSAGELDEYLQQSVPPDTAALAVAGASGVVRTYCRWAISRETDVTFTVDGSGTQILGLPSLYLTNVTSVTVDGVPVDLADVRWSQRGQLYRSAVWPRWSRIEALVDSGYTETPDVIKIVCLSLAGRFVSNPQALKRAIVGAVQRVYADTRATSLEIALLDAFRLP